MCCWTCHVPITSSKSQLFTLSHVRCSPSDELRELTTSKYLAQIHGEAERDLLSEIQIYRPYLHVQVLVPKVGRRHSRSRSLTYKPKDTFGGRGIPNYEIQNLPERPTGLPYHRYLKAHYRSSLQVATEAKNDSFSPLYHINEVALVTCYLS